MITPPFIGACHSTMESEVGEPRRVRGLTRHGGAQYDVARFFGSLFGCFGALEAQRDMAGPNAT